MVSENRSFFPSEVRKAVLTVAFVQWLLQGTQKGGKKILYGYK